MFTISSVSTAWGVVLLSGLLEILFSVSLKLSEGFAKPLPATLSVAAGLLSVWLMSTTLKQIPLGTAYAVWAGIGAAGTALVGLTFFNESAAFARLGCIGLVVIGIVGLQLLSAK